MAVIIDDQANPVYPLRIRSEHDLQGIDSEQRRTTTPFKATKVTIGRATVGLTSGQYVTADTGTESIKIRIEDAHITMTVSSIFDRTAPGPNYAYQLESSGAIKYATVDGTHYPVGDWPHTISLE